jgi:phosphoserine phosphatase
MTTELETWNEGGPKRAVIDFVARVTTPGSPDFVPVESRVAVFDNDGTLWCEKPLPVELGFILQRFAAMAAEQPPLRDRQPWKAAYTKDYTWLGDVVTRHYHGDDSDVKLLMPAILKAFVGMSVEDYETLATTFLRQAPHPTLKRRFRECVYTPMVDLLRYLEEHGFTNYIASGGGRDFMRAATDELYGIPAERVIGSTSALRYREDDRCGSVAYLAEPDVFDDGPAKPVRIWSRIGRRPILAFGNSNGDVQMLQFAGGSNSRSLRLLLMHDDRAREFEYSSGAEQALELARAKDWTVISMKNDWREVFAVLPQISVVRASSYSAAAS